MDDDDTPEAEDDAFDVQGYFQCIDCHQWVVQGTNATASRLCSACAHRRAEDAATAVLNYEVEGRRFEMGPDERIRRRGPQTVKPEWKAKIALRNDAYHTAARRLIVIHQPLFDILYAEEKERRGLNPMVRRDDLPPRRIAHEMLASNHAEMSEAVERVRDLNEFRERHDIA